MRPLRSAISPALTPESGHWPTPCASFSPCDGAHTQSQTSTPEFKLNNSNLLPHAYVLAVNDLPGSVDYFVKVLGFSTEWADGDRWQALVRGEVRLMVGQCPDALPPRKLGDHSYFGFFAIGDVDALHNEFEARGALILVAPADKPWGWREMAVATPEGHRMMFAQPILRD
jgi:predicted enzyme related to lactoylglutathione lyase